MRRKIALALLLLFGCSASGAVLAILHIGRTADTLRGLTKLHRIEEMRQHLIIAIQAAQSDLFTVNTSFGQEVDVITDNIFKLEKAAGRCHECHHVPEVNARIARVDRLIHDYQVALSYYITASANKDRILRLKQDAAALSAELLTTTEDMALQASRTVDTRTAEGLARFDRARAILTATLVLAFLASLVVAWQLARSVTRPIDDLVRATRAIAKGDLGYSLSEEDRTEFGELARHFNTMSRELRESYAALQKEIEERKAAEAQLLYDAFHDALTGLPNRALFVDRLEHVISGAGRHPGESYAVLFLDLDRFKVINDSLGHLVGDHLLVAVGERLAGCIRPGDTVARLGGDEFGLLIQGLQGPGDAVLVAERVHAALSGAFEIEGHEMFVTASIGVAVQADRYKKPDQVLRDADIAMYQAKLKGKACCEIFDSEMHGTVVDRLQLEADLRRAVEHGEEFALHYQPIVALRTGRLVGVEALVRWKHPARGLIQAGDFVSLAEESGIIVPLGEWAVRRACTQLRAWQERLPALSDLTMSVNVSGRQFRRPDLVETVGRILREAEVDPRHVAIEVTESVIMDDVEASAAKLSRLRDMGVQIHVDDFGTGYSSLSYLHRFPINAVKIDRSFVSGLPGHAESEEVIKAIVSIAESLDFDVIAEGIEREEHVEKLEELRCRYGQGHLVAHPLEPQAFESWVAARARSVA